MKEKRTVHKHIDNEIPMHQHHAQVSPIERARVIDRRLLFICRVNQSRDCIRRRGGERKGTAC